MGNNAIFAFMALLILFTVNNNGFNEDDLMAVQNSYGYVKTAAAQSITYSVVDLARFNYENGGSFPYSGTINGGSFTATASFTGDTVQLLTSASYDDSIYNVNTTLLRVAKPFPNLGAALGLSMDPIPSTFVASGYNDTTDNRDWNSGGTIPGSVSTYDISVINKADSATAKTLIGQSALKNINIMSSSQKIIVNASLPNPVQYLNEYIADADSVFTSSSTITGSRTWGTSASPKIIVVNGDSLRSASVGGTIEGWGVLILQRTVSFIGVFKWHGLVIAQTSPSLSFTSTTAQPLIVGSMLTTAPPAGSYAIRGNLTVRYSSAALSNAQNNIRKLQSYKILNWYE